MDITLTPRMVGWIETMGCHLCVATPDGEPFVALGRYAKAVAGDEIAFALAEDEISLLYPALAKNPWVAFGVSRQGGIRAAFQFKGIGRIARTGEPFDTIAALAHEERGIEAAAVLYVKIKEIYCTKPGAEAGQRLDIMPCDAMCAWEEARWKDVPRRRT